MRIDDFTTSDSIALRNEGLTSGEIDDLLDNPIMVVGRVMRDLRYFKERTNELEDSNHDLRQDNHRLAVQVEALIEANLQHYEDNKRFNAIREGLIAIIDGADLGNQSVVRSGIAEIAAALESYVRPDALTSDTE